MGYGIPETTIGKYLVYFMFGIMVPFDFGKGMFYLYKSHGIKTLIALIPNIYCILGLILLVNIEEYQQYAG